MQSYFKYQYLFFQCNTMSNTITSFFSQCNAISNINTCFSQCNTMSNTSTSLFFPNVMLFQIWIPGFSQCNTMSNTNTSLCFLLKRWFYDSEFFVQLKVSLFWVNSIVITSMTTYFAITGIFRCWTSVLMVSLRLGCLGLSSVNRPCIARAATPVSSIILTSLILSSS